MSDVQEGDVHVLEELSRRLDTAQSVLAGFDAYYSGSQPLSFLNAKAKEALGDRLSALAVNYPRLAVDALAERLRVVGFRVDGGDDPALWRTWEGAGLEDGHQVAHVESLTVGRAGVLVWPDPRGNVAVTVESARNVAWERDPATGEVTAAAKRWRENGRARAVLFLPDVIRAYISEARVPEGGTIPPEGWHQTGSIPNPLGEVPLVPFVNRSRLLDIDGVSEMDPIVDLSDSLNKLLVDLLVTSEYYSRPRRWATGLELQYETNEETGKEEPVNPFAKEDPSRVWQSEAVETRFGQFDPTGVQGYKEAVETLTQQIGAMAGLPPHIVGLQADQPPSADAIRSAEASLVSKALARQRAFGPSWAQVARLILAVGTGVRPERVEVIWKNPETRTPSQDADAAAKLVAAKIIPVEQALLDLGYSPEAIEAMREMRVREALDAAPLPPAPTAPPQLPSAGVA